MKKKSLVMYNSSLFERIYQVAMFWRVNSKILNVASSVNHRQSQEKVQIINSHRHRRCNYDENGNQLFSTNHDGVENCSRNEGRELTIDSAKPLLYYTQTPQQQFIINTCKDVNQTVKTFSFSLVAFILNSFDFTDFLAN